MLSLLLAFPHIFPFYSFSSHLFRFTAAQPPPPLRLLFTSDIKGAYLSESVDSSQDFGGLSYLHSVIESQRADAKANNIPTIVLDTGSARGIGLADVLGDGLMLRDYFTNAAYDLLCIGQNDLLLGLDRYLDAKQGGDFTILSSNTVISGPEKDRAASLIKKFAVIDAKVPGGGGPTVKVGFASVLSEQLCVWTSCHVDGVQSINVTDMISSGKNVINDMKASHPDLQVVVLVLSWITDNHFDVGIGQNFELDLDVLLYSYRFGTTRQGYKTTSYVSPPYFGVASRPHPLAMHSVLGSGQSLIVGANPDKGTGVGVLSLDVDDVAGVTLSTAHRSLIVPVWHCPSTAPFPSGCVSPSAATQANVTAHLAAAKAASKVAVGVNKIFLSGEKYICRFKSCGTGSLGAMALLWKSRQQNNSCDFAIANAGAIRGNFTVGNITAEDVLIAYPFNDNIKRVVINGCSSKGSHGEFRLARSASTCW